MTVLGVEATEETAGPTAVTFGRTERDCDAIYVVTTGGILNPVGGNLVCQGFEGTSRGKRRVRLVVVGNQNSVRNWLRKSCLMEIQR